MVDTRQNILFIVMDTVRKDHLSIYGYDKKISPFLEEFSKESSVFHHAISPAPWTLPVHASLFTGLYPGEHGANQERPYLEKNIKTLADSLSNSGYSTACYSSNAWITPFTGLTSGFQDIDNFFEIIPTPVLSKKVAFLYAFIWKHLISHDLLIPIANKIVELGNEIHEFLSINSSSSDSKTPNIINKTIDFISSNDDYFIFINLMDAHLPYNPPKQSLDQFAPGINPSSVCQNSKEYNSGSRDIGEAEWDKIRQLYDAEIHHMDSEIGRLFNWMKSNNEWDNTLVIVCSDHGELHGEHGIYGHEFCIYDPLINVPLIIKNKNIDKKILENQIELIDLYHTILDISGARTIEGALSLNKKRSLVSPLYRNFEGSEFAFIEYSKPIIELRQLESKARKSNIILDKNSRFYSRMRAIRRNDNKYIKNEILSDEFYNLIEDPDELINKLTPVDDNVDNLKSHLHKFEKQIGANWESFSDVNHDTTSDMDENVRDRLRDLGYLE